MTDEDRKTLERRRRFHATIARHLGRKLLKAEVIAVAKRHLARTEPCPCRLEQLTEANARCKALRLDLARQLDMLATLGLAVFARQEKREMVRKVAQCRRDAWACCARLQAEMDAEDALGRIVTPRDVLAN